MTVIRVTPCFLAFRRRLPVSTTVPDEGVSFLIESPFSLFESRKEIIQENIFSLVF